MKAQIDLLFFFFAVTDRLNIAIRLRGTNERLIYLNQFLIK